MRGIAKIGYWLAVAYIPVAIFQFIARYEAAIGCPTRGECYVPGAEHLLYLEMLMFYSAVVLLPAAVWNIVRVVRQLQARGRG